MDFIKTDINRSNYFSKNMSSFSLWIKKTQPDGYSDMGICLLDLGDMSLGVNAYNLLLYVCILGD